MALRAKLSPNVLYRAGALSMATLKPPEYRSGMKPGSFTFADEEVSLRQELNKMDEVLGVKMGEQPDSVLQAITSDLTVATRRVMIVSEALRIMDFDLSVEGDCPETEAVLAGEPNGILPLIAHRAELLFGALEELEGRLSRLKGLGL